MPRVSFPLDVDARHAPPIVGAVGTVFPDMQLVRHAFGMQNPAEIFIVLPKRVGVAYGEYHIHIPQVRESLGAREIRKEMGWHVEIDVLVVVTFEKVRESSDVQCEVITPREGRKLAKEMRVSHGNVHGMVGAEAATVRHDAWVRVLQTHEREDLVEDVFFVLPVPLDAS